MKYLLSILLFFSLTANATNFYFSAAGSDANLGTLASPWLSIAKVNTRMATMAAGDSILFRRGDTFYGGIILTRSGLNFGSYGSGAKPLISGFSTLSTWTAASPNYYATIPVTVTDVKMVTLNGTPTAMGRYPNAGTANGGYLTYETFSGATGITDNQLTGTPNWVGADLVVRKNNWTTERRVITNHVGGNITSSVGTYGVNDNYNNPGVYNGRVNFGYFIQNDLRTLDALGEWFFNKANNRLYMNFGAGVPGSYTIKIATVNVLLNIGSYNTISVTNIDFEGSIRQAVYATNSRNLIVNDCKFTNIGKTAVQIFQSSNCTANRDTVNYALNCGIQMYGSGVITNTSISDCNVQNVGLFPGLATYYDASDAVGIYNSCFSNVYVGRNFVKYTGVDAIRVQSNNLVVENNSMSYFDSILQDHGGIYCFQDGTDAAPQTVYTNGIIRGNFLSTACVGGALGSNLPTTPVVAGIYLDGRRGNMEIYNNTVDSIPRNGIHCNNPSNVYVHDNIFYSCGKSISYFDWNWGSIHQYRVVRNVIWNTDTTQISNYYTNAALNNSTATHITVRQTLDTLGYLDSNYYNNAPYYKWQVEKYDSISYTGAAKGYALLKFNLAGWKTFSGYESHSSILPLVTNANTYLVKNWSSGKTSFPLNGIYQDEKGTKYYSSISMSAYSGKLLYYVGAVTSLVVSSTKTNPSCFGSTGSITLSASGGVRPYTYNTAGPGGYTSTSSSLTGLAAGNYNTTVTDSVGTTGTAFNTIVIPTQLVASSSAGTITVSGGTTTIVVTATGGTPKVSGYTGTGSFVRGAGSYTFTVTDSLGCSTTTSITLVETLPPVKTITFTKTNPNCYGEFGSISTSVTGGTPAYTYLWNDGVTTANRSGLTSGNYSVVVTDAAAVKDTAYATITQPSKITVTKDSVGIITVLGGTTTLHLTATGGTGTLTGVGYFTLTAGTYYKTITDANGCFIIDTITVLYQPPSFTIAFTTINDSCYGSSNGSVKVTATGGVAPFTYYWLAAGQTTQTITGLPAGNYSVTVTDFNGTTNNGAVNITQPSPISINASFGTVSDSTGTTTVVISATGGSGALTGTGTFTQGVGSTVYTVTDSLGCSAQYTVTITITPSNKVYITGQKVNFINKH